MSSGAKVNSQAVADMITALVTMQNKMMAMENNLELGMTTAGAQWKDDLFKKLQEMQKTMHGHLLALLKKAEDDILRLEKIKKAIDAYNE